MQFTAPGSLIGARHRALKNPSASKNTLSSRPCSAHAVAPPAHQAFPHGFSLLRRNLDYNQLREGATFISRLCSRRSPFRRRPATPLKAMRVDRDALELPWTSSSPSTGQSHERQSARRRTMIILWPLIAFARMPSIGDGRVGQLAQRDTTCNRRSRVSSAPPCNITLRLWTRFHVVPKIRKDPHQPEITTRDADLQPASNGLCLKNIPPINWLDTIPRSADLVAAFIFLAALLAPFTLCSTTRFACRDPLARTIWFLRAWSGLYLALGVNRIRPVPFRWSA